MTEVYQCDSCEKMMDLGPSECPRCGSKLRRVRVDWPLGWTVDDVARFMKRAEQRTRERKEAGAPS